MNFPISLHCRRAFYSATVVASAVLLLACGKTGSEPTVAGTAAPAPPGVAAAGKDSSKASAAANAQASEKMNAYTKAYNKLIGTFGLPETQERYFKEAIAQKKTSDNLSINEGWVGIALEGLKKARALPSAASSSSAAVAPNALDSAADPLIAALDTLVAQLKALNIYYESKSYKNDNLARGKAEDPVVRASFQASTKAMQAFSDVLDAEQKKRDTQVLAQLKASGDLLGFHTKLALQQGESLVSLFKTGEDLKNAGKYQQGDALAAELEKTLTQQRELYAAAKAKQPAPDSDHEQVGSSLVSLIGSYRDLKESKKASGFDDMVKNYNRAIKSANDIQ